ncbi:MAG: hypothetical protein WC028_02590 [Candidatus Obscuribacterales bacterium]|jgi:hypothetical protein
MNSLKLYRGVDVIGIVTDPAQDGPETLAKLALTPAAANHKELLDYIMIVKVDGEDPPESLNLWEDWVIEDAEGVMRGIFAPAIRSDAKFISWRWRCSKL